MDPTCREWSLLALCLFNAGLRLTIGWIFGRISIVFGSKGTGQIAAGHAIAANTWFDIASDTPPQLSAVPRAGIYLADTGAQIYTQNACGNLLDDAGYFATDGWFWCVRSNRCSGSARDK
jgi:hypothetical protein